MSENESRDRQPSPEIETTETHGTRVVGGGRDALDGGAARPLHTVQPLDAGVRFAGGRATPPRAAPNDAPARAGAPPERLSLVPLLGTGARCLLVRYAGARHPSLLAMPEPGVGESLDEVVASVLGARLSLRAAGAPRLAEGGVPTRLPQPRRGTSAQGWRRAVVVRVEGEPLPGPLVEEALALPLDEAAAALGTDAERRLLTIATG